MLDALPKILLCLTALLTLDQAGAAALQASVVDAQGKPLGEAVLTLSGGPAPTAPPGKAVMDQVNQQFLPHVLAVRSGTEVSFPNRDDIRHHVYSFSPAKRFELRLYHGTPSAPVLFDKPGLVVLGCNIHDWMVGYIYVTDDAWFGVADDAGKLSLDVPPGHYKATLWHPRNPDLLPVAAGELDVPAGGLEKRFSLVPGSDPAPAGTPPPARDDGGFGDAFRKATREAR